MVKSCGHDEEDQGDNHGELISGAQANESSEKRATDASHDGKGVKRDSTEPGGDTSGARGESSEHANPAGTPETARYLLRSPATQLLSSSHTHT